jgi:hypothetical protein
MDMSIFLSIASYCDPVLPFTLARALATASRPEDLHFGVVDQSPPDAPRLPTFPDAAFRLSYARIDARDARGPCWARAIAMSLYDGEDWYFQIDSHMDFDPGWDERLIAQAEALLPGRPGVVISSYPEAFTFDAERQPVHAAPEPDKVLAHVVKADLSRFDPQHPVLGFSGYPIASAGPLPGFHLGAGCLFAPGAFAQQFPYDPYFYFHGEEQALALRLYTHGWDIFHMPALPVYHLYNTAESGAPARPMHWDESQEAQRSVSWWHLEQRSRDRLAALVAGDLPGPYGLGTARSVADYAVFSGIDYAQRAIGARAYLPLKEG